MSLIVVRKPDPFQNVFLFQNRKMNYRVLGKGRPLILLHGSMTSDCFSGFEKKLAGDYRVFLPDLPGFGASEKIPGRVHNTDLFSQAFCAFIQKTGLSQALVMAFSLGSIVALKAAVSGCFKGKLILVGMPVAFKSRKARIASTFPLFFKRLLIKTTWGREYILIPLLRDLIGPADSKHKKGLLQQLSKTETCSLIDINPFAEIQTVVPKLLNNLKNKTVFIYGENDKLLGLAKESVKKPLVIIPRATHNVFRTNPEELLTVIQKETVAQW